MMLRIAISVGLIANALADNSCVCDNNAAFHRELGMVKHQRVPIEFKPASGGGDAYRRPKGPSHPRRHLKSVLSGSCDSEQVHISFGDTTDSMVVSFVSGDSHTPSIVEYSNDPSALSLSTNRKFFSAQGSAESYSELIDVTGFLTSPAMGDPMASKDEVLKLENTAPWAFDPVTGEHWYNWKQVSTVYTGLGQYNNPYMYYDSPVIHTVTLTGLKGGEKYFYRVGGSCQLFSFVMPATSEVYPVTIGITADIGQTAVSAVSMSALAALKPDYVLLPGDLSYADGWPASWDSFGRLFQSLSSEFPVLTTGGNHEVGSGEAWLSYRARYYSPSKGSNSTNFCYWGREIGAVHVIGLCSYAGFSTTSLQYDWLSSYLATAVDRTRTPWLIVLMHVPMYSSNQGHWMEGELMRYSMEELLYSHGVDLVLAGHVHSYERTHQIYNSVKDTCGPMHITIGDGGNYEGAYADWRFDTDPTTGAKSAPAWTSFREASFGVAGLEILNSTHAKYSWHRHACGSSEPGSENMDFSDDCVTPGDNSAQAMLTSDSVWLVRELPEVCENKWHSTRSSTPRSAPGAQTSSSPGNNSNVELNPLAIGLLVLCCVLVVSNVGLIVVIRRQRQRQQADQPTEGEEKSRFLL